MKYIKWYIALIFCVNIDPSGASFRTDIEDRPSKEVFANSIKLAETLPPAKITGQVIIEREGTDRQDLLTGIPIDPYTILTCAHTKIKEPSKGAWFELKGAPGQGTYMDKASKVIIHPDFRPASKVRNVELLSQGGTYILRGYPLQDIENLTFEEYLSNINYAFKGVDLALLKLKDPLPQNLAYPEFLDPHEEIKDKYGISIGFGTLRYNTADGPPALVSEEPEISNLKHVISCKVSSGQIETNNKVLYGHYKGLLINGDESFIPNKNMLKTEGLPVEGDSGGPLFIQTKEKYKLAGICSATYAFWPYVVENQDLRDKLKEFTQPLFPTWIDVRPHIDWIKSHKGPLQS